MAGIKQYFFPNRRMYRPAKHISAAYARNEITDEQAIVMMAGLARDPEQAAKVADELKRQYGDKAWDYVNLEILCQRKTTFSGQFIRLMRKIFGEDDRPNLRWYPDEAKLRYDYRIED